MQMMTVDGDVNKAVGIYFWGKNRYVIFSCETGTQRNVCLHTGQESSVYSGIYRIVVVVPKYFLGSTLLLLG